MSNILCIWFLVLIPGTVSFLLSSRKSYMRSSAIFSIDGTDYEHPNADDENMQTSSPSMIFLNEFKESIMCGTFLKISLAEPADEFNNVISSVNGRILKDKKMLQFSFLKSKKVFLSKNMGVDEGLQFVQDSLYKPESCNDSTTDEANDSASSDMITFFKLATLETENTEIELKLKKGKGKLKRNDKDATHLDSNYIMNQKLCGDPKTVRKILEDRRLLLLTDPKNQRLKQLYAEAKRAAEIL